MDHKIVTICLMNSRRIYQILAGFTEGTEITSDRDMAVVAALKLLEPAYQGAPPGDIFKDLQSQSHEELVSLARLIHPVLCSLKLEKWLGVSGSCHYLAQPATAKGSVVKRILLDSSAMEIPQPEAPQLDWSQDSIRP